MAPMQLVGALYSWTDDLPKCQRSGVGLLTNQDYSVEDFVGVHSYEDRSFKFQCPNECYLYGVVDGHNGSKVSNFAAQKLPAELLLGQLRDDFTDEQVNMQLHEAFDCLGKAFVEDLISDALMEKIKLGEHLEGIDREEALNKFPTLFKDLEKLDHEISGGCSAAIALIHQSKLFISNIGDSRALLCREYENGDLGLIQLSCDHTISTVAELQRIANLGVDIEKLQYTGALPLTRSIGDWELKGGYKNNQLLNVAESEPVLSSPYVHGGERIDGSMKFLILMSAGVYKAYQDATGTKPNMVNNDITSLVNQEIQRQASMDAVAQAVLDEISLLHYDAYMKSNKMCCSKREDMTLLVRLFNMELGGKADDVPAAVPQTLQTVPETTAPPIVPEKTVPQSKLMRKKSAKKLTPLKMPPPKVMNEPKSTDTDSPSSTGSNTPTSTSVNDIMSTPNGGVSNNESMSPQFGKPPSYPYSQAPLETVPPLETQSSCSSTMEPLKIDVEEEKINYAAGALALGKPIEPPAASAIPFGKHKVCLGANAPAPLPYVMKRSGLYHPVSLQRDAGSSAVGGPNPEALKAASGNDLLVFTEENETEGIGGKLSAAAGDKTQVFNRPPEQLQVDDEGRIQAYVDFSPIHAKIKELGGEEVLFGELMKFLTKNT